jgi:GTP cyclohydrolase I
LKLPQAITEKEFSDREMRVFEREVADVLKNHEKDPSNDDLYKQFKRVERSFNQKLFNVIPRTSNKANSAVWKSDYCREIHLTAYAEQYFKTGMNYVLLLFYNNTLLTIVL